MKRIRVLIVEDSPVVREHLRRIISADPRLEVAGIAETGEQALEMVQRVAPDVISMDIQLPGIQGFEATRRIMSLRPTPIVVVSGMETEDMGLSMQALRSGALAVVEKPVAATHEAYAGVAGRLCSQLVLMSEVKVVRQRDRWLRAGKSSNIDLPKKAGAYSVVGIGASTGGPNALVTLLTGLQPHLALPVMVVQHMTPGFIGGFAEWLSDVTGLRVQVVGERVELSPGTVYVAPTGRHVAVNDTTAVLDDSPPIGGNRPSANVLFSSMARSLGSAGIGVLLTGMGDDGAAGLGKLRDAGGFTIAEAESTAVVYGMPAAAVRMGAVCESLPLGEIAARIRELSVAKSEAD
jgi:two-component system chemotaxis response regulator CheB